MRWLLTLAFVAVAVLVGLKIAQAEKNKGVASDKDDSGRRTESGKDQTGDRSGDKCREKDSESDKRMKEDWDREEDRSTSGRYGKSLEANAQPRFSSPPQIPGMTAFSPRKAEHKSAEVYPMGGILLVLRSLWRSYVSFQHSALAANH
jgi:hypothetical protein